MLVRNDNPFSIDGFVSFHDRDASGVFEAGVLVRLAARLRSRTLDRALIAGADPAATPQLAARAAKLTAKSTRAGTADGLERLARTPSEPHTRPRVLPFRNAIQANASDLYALAALLRGPRPVYAQGVAMLRRLVTDGTGPAYTDRDGGTLAHRLDDARVAIGG